MQYENERMEFKSQLTDDIYKEVIAFTNTDGGVIYIGIDDQGNVTGIDNVDETYTRLTNGIRDAIQPDVTMFVRYVLQENKVIRIEVGEGSYKPYYLKGKGLKPAGVYVRQGATSVQASPEQIRQMIKDSDGDVFEEMRTVQQNLTFDEAAVAFKRYKVDFSEDKYIALGLRNIHDDQYTNLALLLSDQCPHTIKAAVFEGTDQSVFKDRREFSGSLMRQLGEAYDYIDLHNQTHATFQKLLRVDTRDYPEVAVREALLNSLVHRDYSFHASTLISIYDDRIEFVSVGGLLPGLELEDLMMGVSACRNPHLANVFYRLQLIEAYGTGMRKIMGAYAGAATQPQIIATNNAFKIVLPNVNFTATKAKEPAANSTEAPSASHSREDEILRFLAEHPSITRKEAQALLEVSQSTAGRILKVMVDKGQIATLGTGRALRYELV